MAGDPDPETSLAILKGLPKAGADIVEFGLPFTDPMADGPAIQAAGLRALKAGQNTVKTLDLVRRFREEDADTPVILMGYFNPIYRLRRRPLPRRREGAGVDGLIVVDLPPEEDDELCLPALKAGLAFIRLATPTTDDKRLPAVLSNTAGFVYYVSITGITGAATPDFARSRRRWSGSSATPLPVVVGFGVKTGAHAGDRQGADGVVVGSALVDARQEHPRRPRIAQRHGTVEAVTKLVKELSDGVRSVAKGRPNTRTAAHA